MAFSFFKKKVDPAIQLAKDEQKISRDDMIIRNPNEAEQDALFREQKEKMVMYRMWQQDWSDKRVMNFEYLSGYFFTKDGNLIHDDMRRSLCKLDAAFELNHFMAHQDRNLMNGTFADVNDRNRYMKHNISVPLINDIFENYEKWGISDSDFRQIVINTTNPVDNGTRRALNNGERMTDKQIIKTHELSTPNREEKRQTFMGVPIK